MIAQIPYRENYSYVNPRNVSGITLVEVIVSMSILMLSIISIISGFIFIQRSAMDSAYYTGGQRILQSHVEGLIGMPTKDLITTNFVAFNYSGLRVSSSSDETVQAATTNVSTKTFQAFTRAGGNIVNTNITVAEDAVLAYSIFYNVSSTNIVGTYMGVSGVTSYTKPYRKADVLVMWHNTRGMSNRISATIMKPEEN